MLPEVRNYLDDVRSHLHLDPVTEKRVISELYTYFQERIEELQQKGVSEGDATFTEFISLYSPWRDIIPLWRRCKVNTASAEEWLLLVHPSQRILLLPHCLRPSQTCPGKYSKRGLECPEDCTEDCTIGRLRRAALSFGYKGVCIAPGGRLAVKYVKEKSPKAIVAVACQKELEEGIHGVRELSENDKLAPPIVIIPLVKDGCVDTEVDEEQALKMITLGCSLESVEGGAWQVYDH